MILVTELRFGIENLIIIVWLILVIIDIWHDILLVLKSVSEIFVDKMR